MRDYCTNTVEARPFYWLEESVNLYSRANELIIRLEKMSVILNSAELEALIDIDLDLVCLWESFEKDAMVGIEKIKNKSLAPIRVPYMFGYPSIIFYYNGTIISKTTHVLIL